jgi:hypothetical protein
MYFVHMFLKASPYEYGIQPRCRRYTWRLARHDCGRCAASAAEPLSVCHLRMATDATFTCRAYTHPQNGAADDRSRAASAAAPLPMPVCVFVCALGHGHRRAVALLQPPWCAHDPEQRCLWNTYPTFFENQENKLFLTQSQVRVRCTSACVLIMSTLHLPYLLGKAVPVLVYGSQVQLVVTSCT